MRGITFLLAALSVGLLPRPAYAAPEWCTSKINNTFVDIEGNVFVDPVFRGDYLQICNVNVAWKGVSVELCRTWQALSMSAILADKPMIIYYANVPSCATIPSYSSAPSPGYMMLRKQ